MKIVITLLFLLLSTFLHGQIVINEISQGPSGSQEYIELLVTGPTNACPGTCVDIRGWILDDNNGWHRPGTGSGIAQGALQLANHPQWECVPIGSLIVIYNELQINSAIGGPDPYDSDKNCSFVVPGNQIDLLNGNSTQPSSTGTSDYSLVFPDAPTFNFTSMANNGDSYHLVAPGNETNPPPAFSVSWGNNATPSNLLIYFSGSATGLVYYMDNSTDDNPDDQTNWSSGSVNTFQTPGFPNTPDNANYINGLSMNCLRQDTLLDVICENDSIYIGGEFVSLAGLYKDTLIGFSGCDSVVLRELVVVPFGSCVLPIYINGFSVENINGLNHLKWSVNDSYLFNIERSSNGVNFYSIGQVFSGSSGEFYFIDKSPLCENYYRLLMENNVGEIMYSDIVFIDTECLFSTYYNPVNETVLINYTNFNDVYEISIISMLGEVLYFKRTNNLNSSGFLEISVKNYLSGIYIVIFGGMPKLNKKIFIK